MSRGAERMTIAIAIKVNDAVVLASDSASSIVSETGGVIQVYDHADKIFNLHKGLPIGVATYGVGSIGQSSLSTLARDFRRRVTGGSGKVDKKNYQLRRYISDF